MEIYLNWGCTSQIIPPYYDNEPHYSNYLAHIVGIDENGKEIRHYQRASEKKGCYYYVNDLQQRDIIVSSFYDNKTKEKERKFYVILFKNDFFLHLKEITEGRMRIIVSKSTKNVQRK